MKWFGEALRLGETMLTLTVIGLLLSLAQVVISLRRK